MDVDAGDEAKAERAAAIVELQQLRHKLVAQRDCTALLVPEAVAAFDAKIRSIDANLLAKRAEQLGDAQPQQIAQLVAQHQSALGAAQLELAAHQTKMDERLAAFDRHAASVAADFDKQLEVMTTAKKAAADGFASERADIAAAHQRLVKTASSKADAAKLLLDQASQQQQSNSRTALTGAGLHAITIHPPPIIAQLPQPSPDDLPHLAKAVEILEHHQCQDEVFPISYGTLGLKIVTIAHLVGQGLWAATYPQLSDGGDHIPPMSAEIPNRVLGTLRVALTRMAIEHSARQAASTEAQEAVRLAAEAHSAKRTRIDT